MMLKCRLFEVFLLLAALAFISVNAEGCYCKTGYVRNNKGVCVFPECPTNCGAHEVYSECGTACPLTCENKDEVFGCAAVCVRGCFCEKGYVRDKNNKCIMERQCPKTCGANAEYSECGANGCQKTCKNPTLSQVCKGICTPGCICKAGYLKNSNGKCVLPEHCACGTNEKYSECGANGCQNTCKNPTLSQVCKGTCTPGCICMAGYLKNSKGKCVLPDECDSCKKPFEIFNICDNHRCQNTCEKPDLITRCTLLPGCYPGCICQQGYLRNKAGDCVPENTCHLKTTTCKPTTRKPKRVIID